MSAEFLMKYTGRTDDLPSPTRSLDCEEEDGTLYYYEGEELVGELSVYIEEHRVNLYNVLVMPELRHRGYGHDMLLHFLREEFPYLHEIFPVAPADRELVLQVSEANAPAVALYRSCGFTVAEAVTLR